MVLATSVSIRNDERKYFLAELVECVYVRILVSHVLCSSGSAWMLNRIVLLPDLRSFVVGTRACQSENFWIVTAVLSSRLSDDLLCVLHRVSPPLGHAMLAMHCLLLSCVRTTCCSVSRAVAEEKTDLCLPFFEVPEDRHEFGVRVAV
jgi:hypothetical protein